MKTILLLIPALAVLPLAAQQTTVLAIGAHAGDMQVSAGAAPLASIAGWKVARSIIYAGNWEDPEGFQPYLFVNTTEDMEAWRKATQCYEFLRGGVSPFPCMRFYEGLSMVRGAQARKPHATAFETGAMGKRRVVETWP